MGWKCNVPGCRSGYASTKKDDAFALEEAAKISFHRFPTEPDLRLEWLKNIQRKNWEPLLNSHVCSLHFKEEDFQINSKDENKSRKKPLSWNGDKIKQRRLLPDAVPTIFSNSPLRSRKSIMRKSAVNINYKEEIADDDGYFNDGQEMQELPSSEVGFFTNEDNYPLPISKLKVIVLKFFIFQNHRRMAKLAFSFIYLIFYLSFLG